MNEKPIHEISVEKNPVKVGLVDRLRQIPTTAREHIGALSMAAIAGISLVVPALHAGESLPVHDSTAKTELGSEPGVEQAKVSGYWMLAKGGTVQAFGNAKYHGSGPSDAVAIAATATGDGYYMTQARTASILPYGDAKLAVHGLELDWAHGEAATGIAAMPEGEGVWVVTSSGRVRAEGNAHWYGDMFGKRLNKPMKNIVPTPSGKGYWLQATDGGVFSFGDAKFYGSTGSMRLNQPINGMIADPDGKGYWLTAGDGGIFSFDARFHGSTGNLALKQPIVEGVPSTQDGYALLGADGNLFPFGDFPNKGSAVNNPAMKPVISIATQITRTAA